MNISDLFNISLLLNENSISGVNGLAGKGLKQGRKQCGDDDTRACGCPVDDCFFLNIFYSP